MVPSLKNLIMKKSSIFFAFIAIIALFSSCNDNGITVPFVPNDFNCEADAKLCELTTANSQFGFELFQTLHKEEPNDNIFISPFSISTALTMTLNGANQQTYDDMAGTLHLGQLEQEQINASFKKLLTLLPILDPATKLRLANSIWPQKDYPVLDEFLRTNEDFFNSEIRPIDFSNSAPVIEEVNKWVEDNTEGLIKETLTSLPPDVVMLLINAIYFKGSWATEFNVEDTQQADFIQEDGTIENVDMMHMTEHKFPYFQNDLFQAIDLPYGDSIYSMSILLPQEGKTVDDVVKALNVTSWEDWRTSFYTQEVDLFMPKFKMEYDAKLKPILSDMGMGVAFSNGADFSKMIDRGGVKIDEVIHKAFIEVDEKGTEAAAVTVVIIVETSVPIIPVMNLNRPFVFMIRENQTNSVLFMGKLMTTE